MNVTSQSRSGNLTWQLTTSFTPSMASTQDCLSGSDSTLNIRSTTEVSWLWQWWSRWCWCLCFWFMMMLMRRWLWLRKNNCDGKKWLKPSTSISPMSKDSQGWLWYNDATMWRPEDHEWWRWKALVCWLSWSGIPPRWSCSASPPTRLPQIPSSWSRRILRRRRGQSIFSSMSGCTHPACAASPSSPPWFNKLRIFLVKYRTNMHLSLQVFPVHILRFLSHFCTVKCQSTQSRPNLITVGLPAS